MSLGFSSAKADCDARSGTIAMNIRDALSQAQRFKAWLDTQTDAQLITLGYVQAEVNTLRSAFVDLNDLANLYTGVASTHLTGTYDYRTFAKLLVGVA